MTATDVPGSTPDPNPSQKDLRGNSTNPNPVPAEGATPEFALELDLGLTNDYFASKLERDILRDIENYDINKIPPSMEHAQLHAECCKFGQPIQNLEMEKVKFCPCCCNIETLPFDAFVSTEDLDCFGPVIPLFFQFSKFLILLAFLFCLFAAVGQYYIIKANCSPGVDPIYCKKNIKMIVVYAHRDLSDRFAYYNIASMLLAGMTVLTFLCFGMFHKRAIKLKEKIDKGMITASDYTVMMYDIAPENESKEYIQNYIASLVTNKAKRKPEIVKINIGKFEGNLMRLKKEIADVEAGTSSITEYLKAQEKTLEKELKEGLEKKLETLETKKKALKEKLEDYEARIKANPGFRENSIAFVSMKYMIDAEKVYEQDTDTRKVLWILSKVFWCCTRKKVHYVRQAPEPDDIKWKFIGFSPFQRGKTYLVSYLVTFLAIGFSFGVQMGVRILQATLDSRYNGKGASKKATYLIRALGVLGSVVVSLANFLLVALSMRMSRYEKHLSYSMFTLSHTRKLIVLQFINTAGIVIALTYLPQELGGVKYFAETVFMNQVTNLCLNPLLHAFDPSHLVRVLKQRSVNKKMSADSNYSEMTQKELNELFEPADITIYLRYCSVIRTFFVSCFFFHALPSGMLVCFVFLVVQFWVDKLMVLRRYKRPTRYHHSLNFSLAQFAEKSVLLMILGHIAFKHNLAENLGYPGFPVDLACLVVACLLIFFPIFEYAQAKVNEEREYLNNRNESLISKLRSARNTTMSSLSAALTHEEFIFEFNRRTPFSVAYLKFDMDFDRANPITHREATKQWAMAKYKKEKDSKEDAFDPFAEDISQSHTTAGPDGPFGAHVQPQFGPQFPQQPHGAPNGLPPGFGGSFPQAQGGFGFQGQHSIGGYPPGPGFPPQNQHHGLPQFGTAGNGFSQQPYAATSDGWNNYLNTSQQTQSFEPGHGPQTSFGPVFPGQLQPSPFSPQMQMHQPVHFYQPISSPQFSSTQANEYTAEDDWDFQELRLLNLKRNLYGYNSSFSHR